MYIYAYRISLLFTYNCHNIVNHLSPIRNEVLKKRKEYGLQSQSNKQWSNPGSATTGVSLGKLLNVSEPSPSQVHRSNPRNYHTELLQMKRWWDMVQSVSPALGTKLMPNKCQLFPLNKNSLHPQSPGHIIGALWMLEVIRLGLFG